MAVTDTGVAEAPPKSTCVTPDNPKPLTVTKVPTAPLDGENPLIRGASTKLDPVMKRPPGESKVNGAAAGAPGGTTTVMSVLDTTVRLVVLTPPKETEDTARKLRPLKVRVSPTRARDVKAVTQGAR